MLMSWMMQKMEKQVTQILTEHHKAKIFYSNLQLCKMVARNAALHVPLLNWNVGA